MDPVEVLIVAGIVVVYALTSRRLAALSITMPMVLVGAGWLLAGTGVVDARVEREAITVLAELTLAVILFGDAVRIDPTRLRRQGAMPARLLLIGLPLSVVVGAAVGGLVLTGVTIAQVALLAAVLAPTDAALGAAVVEDPVVPDRERLALNVESGVNDGLAVPIVAILTAIVLDERRGVTDWVGFIARQIGFGVVIGLLLGGVAVRALLWVHHRGWSDGRYEQLATFLVPVVALLAADEVGGNSFIAAFVAGVTFGAGGAVTRDDDVTKHATHFCEFTEDAAQLLAVVAFFLFGNVFVEQVVPGLTWQAVVVAIASLTIVRMLPVWIALIGTSTRWQTRVFIGWFGPRGLASIVFGLLLLEEVEQIGPVGEELFGVIALTVMMSVVLHGVTAARGARIYGAWARAAGPEPEVMHHMPAVRWSTHQSGRPSDSMSSSSSTRSQRSRQSSQR